MNEAERFAWVKETKQVGMRTLHPEFRLQNNSWRVKTTCQCGTVAFVRLFFLLRGEKDQCLDCYRSRAKKYDTEEKTRLLIRLANAKNRCENKTTPTYRWYGARGIRFSFASVSEAYDWVVENLGHCPEGMSLDRIDNSGNYAPGNLRWASATTQANNKRPPTRKHGGKITALQKLRPDLQYEAILRRVQKGMTNEEVVNTPKCTHKRKVNHE